MDNNIADEYYLVIRNKISESNFDSALYSIEKLLYSYPKDEKAYYYRGVIEFAQERYEEAVNDYITAIKLKPNFGKAYFNIGVCYYTLQQIDNALVAIGKAFIIFSIEKDLEKRQRTLDALRYIQADMDRI